MKPTTIKSRTTIIFILLALFTFAPLTSQVTYEHLKSAMIYKFVANVKWQNSASIGKYKIGLYGKDATTYNHLISFFSKNKLHGRKVEIIQINKKSEIQNVHILIVNEENSQNIYKIAELIERKHILLITDRCPDPKYIMLNFILKKDNKGVTFEINKANIIIEGLIIEPELLLLGGREIDVRELYREIKVLLNQNNIAMAKHQKQIKQQKTTLNKQTKKIKVQKESMENFALDIKDYENDILVHEELLKDMYSDIQEQNIHLSTKLKQINGQEVKLKEQKNNIVSKQNEIKTYNNKLDSLNKIATNKQEVIAEQNQLLGSKDELIKNKTNKIYMFFGLVVVTFLLLLTIVFAYRIKNNANKNLEKKVNKRTEELQKEIIERKIIEKNLIIAKDTAEENDKLKSAFLANMSHEIRTPMNGIVGFSEILKRNNITSEKRKEYVEIIIRNSNKLLSLVSDILDISKVETGQMNVILEPFNIHTLLEEIYTFFAPVAEQKELKILLSDNISANIISIISDKNKIRHIYNNLLSNAIKFTEKGQIEIKAMIDNKNIIFSVKDTGIGITEEQKKRIFERFQQAETKTSYTFGGTGLGLSISKAFVELLDGKIWVESIPNKETTFFFIIPIEISTDDTELQEKITNKTKILDESIIKDTSKKIKILIAEDEDNNYFYYQELLTSKNIELLRARTGIEAVDYCKQQKDIDIVLMDIKMPIMDGYEATSKIKKFRPDLPIIAQTAFAMTHDNKKALSYGCDDYISKPIKRDKLFQIIRKHI